MLINNARYNKQICEVEYTGFQLDLIVSDFKINHIIEFINFKRFFIISSKSDYKTISFAIRFSPLQCALHYNVN